MSRVLLVALDERQVEARCRAENVGISAERLATGGVRVVCMSSDGAARMGLALKRHLIEGVVTRERHRPTTPLC
jgi:hypothetical protein